MPKLEQIRKTLVALVASNATAIALVAQADFSTWQNILTFVLAEMAAFGVYVVPNTPPPAPSRAKKK